MQRPLERTQRPRERSASSRERQTPQKVAQLPQEAQTKKVSSEVSLQMSSRFASQQVPQDLTRHWPHRLTY
jgi:hypothetical protein